MPESNRKLTDEEIAVIVESQERSAYSFSQSEIAQDRSKALDYYLGKPFGNEVEGRSQVVSTDVFDTIESMLPALLETFTSSNKIAECEAYGIEDEAEAKQQTEVANHILFKQNNAPLIFYTWFKDALLSKNGVIKFFYDPQQNEHRMESYQNLTEQELQRLAQDDKIEIKSISEHELMLDPPMQPGQPQQPPQPMKVFDAELKVYTKRNKVKICNVPPENFYVTARQNSLNMDECEFCSHKERKTITDLLEMGFSEEELSEIHDSGDLAELSSESIARNLYSEQTANDVNDPDPSLRQLWCSDAYMLIDADGDGVAELRHIFMAGNKVLINEETDKIPFAVISPILFPHQFYGLSAADITMDVQLYKSTIHRQMMDGLYLSNNPRNAVIEGMVNMDDLLTSRPGGIVRMRAPGAVTPLITPFIGKESFPMLEYWETVKEQRTGSTRYTQGLDADSLNKTAHGISQIMAAGAKRQELIARLFAETGVKALVKGILHCVAKSGMKNLTVRLTNGYVNVDPRQWKNQYDVTINVALGTGTKDRQIQLLNLLSQKQLELKQTGRGYMVSEANDYNLAVKLSEATGFKNPELFFTDPTIVPPQAKQPPPNPEMLKLQADVQYKQADMQATTQAKQADMANDKAIEEMKANIGAQADIAVAKISQETQIAVAKIKADMDARLKAADIANDGEDRSQAAQIKVFEANKDQAPINAAQHLEQTSQQLIASIGKLVEELGSVGQQIVGGVQQVMDQNKVTRTSAKKDKSGKLVGTVKEYADGRIEEVPHSTIQ